ncbi:related to MED7 - member of RNA Polymerase II transcriptional regulation mediator complex [Cephalotrichum gorgonifer]|uniref:Mediator of RNA polymerase II transcription subunit 7 n=1 Tax=Cephalotrichum gorgonifer TaxID=2041049 RepID=A0AAE8SXH0_9PEZI|nr:related to MED7 - member of RNA Polymerase II transcriptional regulation mediator complex [Cephalotrichum gorgonifer]
MADQESQQPSRSALASTWPNPPPFFEAFTEENLERFRQFAASHQPTEPSGEDASAAPAPVRRLADVPEDLVLFQPPAEPTDGTWRVFGDQYSLADRLPELEEQGIQRLGPEQEPKDRHRDRALELKRLAKSLLLNFLELLGIMGIDPAQAEEKLNDLRTLLINFHHTLNEYRPHQARESTIAMMQDHLDRTRAETAAVREAVDRTKRVIEGLGSIEVPAERQAPASDATGGDAAADGGKDGGLGAAREAEVWGAADELLG